MIKNKQLKTVLHEVESLCQTWKVPIKSCQTHGKPKIDKQFAQHTLTDREYLWNITSSSFSSGEFLLLGMLVWHGMIFRGCLKDKMIAIAVFEEDTARFEVENWLDKWCDICDSFFLLLFGTLLCFNDECLISKWRLADRCISITVGSLSRDVECFYRFGIFFINHKSIKIHLDRAATISDHFSDKQKIKAAINWFLFRDFCKSTPGQSNTINLLKCFQWFSFSNFSPICSRAQSSRQQSECVWLCVW